MLIIAAASRANVKVASNSTPLDGVLEKLQTAFPGIPKSIEQVRNTLMTEGKDEAVASVIRLCSSLLRDNPSDLGRILPIASQAASQAGWTTFVARPGERFDSRLHRMAGGERHRTREEIDTVAKPVGIGILDQAGETVVPADVVIFA